MGLINKEKGETHLTLFSAMTDLLRKLFKRTDKPTNTMTEQSTVSFQIEKEIIYIHTDDEIG